MEPRVISYFSLFKHPVCSEQIRGGGRERKKISNWKNMHGFSLRDGAATNANANQGPALQSSKFAAGKKQHWRCYLEYVGEAPG